MSSWLKLVTDIIASVCYFVCITVCESLGLNRDTDSAREKMLRGSVLCPTQAVEPFNCMRRADEVEW